MLESAKLKAEVKNYQSQCLTPMDMYFFRPGTYTIQFLFRYDYPISRLFLEKAVSRLIAVYPMFSRKIVPRGNFVYFEPHLAGIRVTERRFSQKGLSHINNDDYFDEVQNIPGEPLIKIQLNYVEGQTYLGLSFSHILGDGASVVLFMKALTAMFRGEPLPQVNFDRDILTSLVKTVPFNPRSLFLNTGYTYPRPQSPRHSVELMEYIDMDKIGAIKKRSSNDHKVSLSTNVIIMGLLFKKYYGLTSKNSEGKYVLRCPVDYRKRLNDLSSNYFGNAVTDAFVELSESQITTLTAEEIAVLMKTAIDRIDSERIQNSLSFLDTYRRKKGIGAFKNLSCPGFLFTNFTHLDFKSFDFGRGGPTEFKHCSMNPRLAVIMKKGKGYAVKIKLPLGGVSKSTRLA